VLFRSVMPLLKGRDGTDTSYETDTILIGAGESFDVIFTAPAHSGPGYDTYMLYNRRYSQEDNLGGGGQRTEVRVYSSGTLPDQSIPNT
jgi:hypothetical protein